MAFRLDLRKLIPTRGDQLPLTNIRTARQAQSLIANEVWGSMTFLKYVTLSVMAVVAIQVCSAQSKFPLRSGEWEAEMSVPGSPNSSVTMLYCLNDALWQKALTQDPLCSVQQLAITSSGGSYSLVCEMKSFQMKGKVNLVFDGLEHMTAKSQVDITMAGKTTSSASVAEYRWKGATCSPNDANLKAKKAN